MNSITISTAEELSTFCHELSKHVNLSASSIKSAIAKMQGYDHVSAYMKALNEQTETAEIYMSATDWLNDFDASISPHDTWHRRAKPLLYTMILCIEDAKPEASVIGFSLSDLMAISTPLTLTSAFCEIYGRSNNTNLKEHIVRLVDGIPSGHFAKAFAGYRESGVAETTSTFLEQLGYMTMHIEPFLKEKQGRKLN